MARASIASALLGVAVAWTMPGRAAASDDDSSTDGSDVDRFRVHLGLDLASWIRQVPWPRTDDGPVGSRDYIGFVGFRRFGFGFGIAHGFRDVVVAGVHVEYGISRGLQRTPWEVEGPRAVELGAWPYVEVLLVRKHVVRPFAMLRGGVGGALVALDGGSPVDRPRDSASLLTPSIGIGLGAHGFVTEDVSIDGLFTVDHRWEYLRLRGGIAGATDLVTSPTTDDEQIEMQAGHHPFGRRFSVAIGIAVSRWF